MPDRIDSMDMAKRAVCIHCGRCIEDGTVKQIDRWIVEDDGDLICPECQTHETYGYG